ncbi:MAG: hypothetical protein WBE76_28650 [Terracidiphilus sp.]
MPAEPPCGHTLPANTIAPPANAISRTASIQKSRSRTSVGKLGCAQDQAALL